MYILCSVHLMCVMVTFLSLSGMVISFDRPKYFGFVNSPLQFWIMTNGSGNTDNVVVKVTLDGGT